MDTIKNTVTAASNAATGNSGQYDKGTAQFNLVQKAVC